MTARGTGGTTGDGALGAPGASGDPGAPGALQAGSLGSEIDSSGLPPDALKRLSELGARGATASLFTSDLSVNEFLLVEEVGFHPRGLVFGSSIYHIGLRRRGIVSSRELGSLTQAMYTARELAMARMEAEAELLGADGVVGVRLDVNFYDWGRHSAEFIAIGTAVSAGPEAGAVRTVGTVGGTVGDLGGSTVDAPEPMSWRTGAGKPFTSDLSGQDFWTLVRAGYAPLGLVMGTCVYHVGYRSPAGVLATSMRNAELPHFTQALYEARELAMARMQAEAASLGAAGIVGVQLVEKSHFWGSHVIEFLAIGTAVRPIRPDHVIDAPLMILTLDQ